MHRTRHSSLDYLGANMSVSTQEEWSEFLSTSMMALSTSEAEPADGSAVPPPASPRPQTPDEPLGEDTFEPATLAAQPRGRGKKPRTMSESLAGSMSPPALATDAWRPLGRRVSPSALTRSSSSSSTSSPPGTANPTELQPQLARRGVDPKVTALSTSAALTSTPPTFGRLGSSSSMHSSTDTGASAARLQHTSSFREVVNSCLSSSGSSFYDSSSDDEQHEGGADSNQAEGAMPTPTDASVPAPPPMDSAYAESCLPVLSQLPRPPRSISVDSGGGSRAGSLAHVKSPVLSSRKDSQTWQLQDEEFFMTSPRFGASLRSGSGPGSPQVDLFRGNSVGSLVPDDGSNQFHEEFQGHPRLTKESRALSVDFTLGRSQEVSPPLPPPQEPLQRLRARSFSYSQAYGASGYNPAAFTKQQFVPHHQHQVMPPQEYPPTLRGFHGGPAVGMMPPPNASPHQHQHHPHPPPVGVRPPRVSIPTDSPMHQYHQYGPPMPIRRYSTDTFAMTPYPESYGVEEQENQARQGNTGRGLRSYSMEYGGYSPSSRQVRSQSMEGPQLFAPPMEFPPSLSRSNSAGVAFDWPRGAHVHARMDSSPAPPLPPDTRPNSSNATSNSGHYPPPPPEAYYDVEFKRGRQEVFAGRLAFNPGEYVKVEADRGEDIGRIVQRTTDLSKLGAGGNDPAEEPMGRGKRHDLPTKKIICVASTRECEMLSEQRKEEHEVFEVCKSKVRQRLLPMNVIDAEYQFDRHKLTFFFEAERRIDFRELVRDLFAIYKTRIWLQQVVPSGKKTGGELETN